MRSPSRRWRLNVLARACALAALGIGAGTLHGAASGARLDNLLGCPAAAAASFVERLTLGCGDPFSLGRALALPRLGQLDAGVVRSYFGPGDGWANPLNWIVPGEPMHDEVVQIASPHSVTYAPVLHPNAVFRRIEVGQTFLPGNPPPANGFSITPSAITDRGFYVDRGAGSFAPVLTQSSAARTLRTGAMEVGVGMEKEGALLISAGAVEVTSRFTLGSGSLSETYPSHAGLGYLRLAAGGEGAPELRIGENLAMLSERGGQAFVQMEAGRIAIGGSLLMGQSASLYSQQHAFMNLAGGTLNVTKDVVLGGKADVAWNFAWAGIRQGVARHEVGRDLILGAGGVGDYETMAGSFLSVGRDLLVGDGSYYGWGQLRHGGGTLVVTRDLVVASRDDSQGFMQIVGNAGLSVGGQFVVGAGARASAELVVAANGAALSAPRVVIGRGGARGTADIAGLSLTGDMTLGESGGTGTLVARDLGVTGTLAVGGAGGFGTLTVPEGGVLRAGHLHVGVGSGQSSFAALAGSRVEVAGDLVSSWTTRLEGAQVSVGGDMRVRTRRDNFGSLEPLELRNGAWLTVGRDLLLGREAGETHLTVFDGVVQVGRHLVVGDTQPGNSLRLDLQPGSRPQLKVGGDLVLGAAAGSEGTLSVSPNVFNPVRIDFPVIEVLGASRIGDAGTGSLVLFNGDARLGLVTLGQSAGGSGWIDLAERGRLTASNLFVGAAGDGQVSLHSLGGARPALLAGALAVGTGSGRGVVEATAGDIVSTLVQVGTQGRVDLGGTARLQTEFLNIAAQGQVALPGSFLIGASHGDHGAWSVDVRGGRLSVPDLVIGVGGTYKGDGASELVTATTLIDGGTVTGTLTSHGVLTVRSGNLLGATLRHHGTVDLSQAPLVVGALESFAAIAIGAGEQIRVTGEAGQLRSTAAITVAGRLVAEALPVQLSGADARIVQTAGEVRMVSLFGNGDTTPGAVDLRGGRMVMSDRFARGILQVSGGELSIGGGAEITGRFEQTGGSVSIAGLLSTESGRATTVNLSGGSLAADAIEIGGEVEPVVFTHSGGSLSVGGRFEVLARGELHLNGGTFESGSLDITRRRLRDAVPAGQGSLVLFDWTGQGLTLNGGPITNSGLVKWSRGDVAGTASLVNAPDGTFEIEVGPSILGLPVDNDGTLLVRSFSQPRLTRHLNHGGSLQIEPGAWLSLHGGATGAGSIAIAGQLSLQLYPAGDYRLGGHVQTASTGALIVAAPSVFTGTALHAGLVFVGGGPLTLDGAQWRFGAGAVLGGNWGRFALRAGSVDFDQGSELKAFVSPVANFELELTGGSLRMNAGSRIVFPERFAIEGSAVSLSTGQPIHLAQDFSLSAGRLDGSDDLLVDSGRFSFSGGTLAGSGSMTIERNAVLDLGGAAGMTLDRTLHLSGQGLLSFGQVAGSGLLRVDSFTDFTATGSYSFAPALELRSRWISNPGASGVGQLLGRVDILGSGLHAHSGRLLVAGGGSSDGAVVARPGSTVDFGGVADFVFDSAQARLSGAGQVEFTGGRTLLRNGASLDSTGAQRVAGGTLELGAGAYYSFVDGLSIDAGALLVSTGAGNFTLPQGMVMRGGQLGGTDARRIDASRVLDWQGGEIAGPALTTVAAGGQVRISGAAAKALHGDLLNQGLVRWEGGGGIGGAGRLTNAAGALFEIDGSGGMSPALVNDGLTRVLGGRAAQVSIGGSLDNRGTLDVEAGARLSVTGSLQNLFGGTFSAGVWNIAGTLVHAGSPVTNLDADVRLSGAQAFLRGAGNVDLLDSVARVAPGGRLFFEGGRALAIAGDRTLTVDGLVEVGAGSVLSAALGRLDGAGTVQVLGGGTLVWTGANLSATGSLRIDAGATLLVQDAGSDHYHVGRAIANQGTVQWTAGNLRAGNGSSILNAGLWEDDTATGHSVNNFSGSQLLTFTNTGTYRKTGAGTTQFHGQRLDNRGRVELVGGALQFNAGGVNRGGGVIDIAAGRVVTLGGSTFGFEDGSAVTGAGTLVFDGAITPPVATIDGRVSFANLVMRGGSVAGTHTLDGRISWTGGMLAAGGTTTIGAGATLLVQDAGSDHYHAGRAIVNQGTVQWTAGNLHGGNGSSILNAGLWEDTTATGYTINNFGGGPLLTFTNTGTYRKTGAGTTQFHGQRLDNRGRVELVGGALQFNAGGVNRGGGVIDIAAGRVLTLGGSGFEFEDGSAVTGAGTLVFDGASSPPVATIDGRVSFANLVMRGGTVAGTHTLDGRISWMGGMLAAGGTTTIGAGATLLVQDAGSDHYHVGRAIANQGTVQWTAGDLRAGNGSSILNAGLWEDDTATGHSLNSFGGNQQLTVTNTGTYRKTGAGTTQFHGQRLDNSGRVEVQQGTLQLNAGVVQMAGGQLAGGQWEVGPGAVLSVPGVSPLTVNSGVVHLRGLGSSFGAINALADNRGEFRVSEGRNFTTAGGLLNSGLLFAGTGSVLTVNGALNSTGSLGGGGEIRVLGEAHVTGQVNPGSSPGVLTLGGNLSLDAGSVLNIEIEGLGVGSGYDRLEVTGRATLGGALAVHLPTSFAGLAGASFTIVSANEVVGQFAGLADGDFVSVNGLPGRFVIDYQDHGVVLDRFTAAVPEPQTYALMAGGLSLLAWAARRRRRGSR